MTEGAAWGSRAVTAEAQAKRGGKQTTALVAPADLAERLRARRGEIEEALRVRTYAISDPRGTTDPAYVDGLREALEAALEYGLSGIETGAERLPPIPSVLLTQARVAARNGISLQTVLRRYFGGYALLGDFLIEAAGEEEISGSMLKRLLRTQAILFDCLIAAVSEAHGCEAEARTNSFNRSRLGCVRRLLDGELADASELNYDLGLWHLAAIAKGQDPLTALGRLAARLDRRLLAVTSEEETTWAWLGGRREFWIPEIEKAISETWPERLCLALGEPAQGPNGWRLSHRQASAALAVAPEGYGVVTRYGDVALLASAARDGILVKSLREIYLAPLAQERDGGARLRETLSAYFSAGRQVSATAATLHVSRQTVSSRLHAVEGRIGRPLDACAAEMQLALELERLSTRQVFGAD